VSAVKPRNQRAPKKTLPSIGDELSLMGLMHAPGETPAGTARKGDDGGTAELFASGGFGVIVLPPEIFGYWEKAIRARLLAMVTNLTPPRTAMEAACYGVLGEMARLGKTASPEGVVLGLALAAAKCQGVRIKTHARDLAKEAKVRYQTLLLVQRLALAEFTRWGLFPRQSREDED
jgi:hypothetical protein